MKFKYIGDHDQITQHGVTFRRNEPVDVTGKKITFRKSVPEGRIRVMKDVHIMVEDKLKGNPDYEEVIEFEGNEIIPKQRKKPGPKPKHGNQARYQEQGITPA